MEVYDLANIKSAKKRILVNQTKAERNKAIKSAVKTSMKKVEAAVANKGIIIKYASYNLRNNKEIAEIAIKQDKRAYNFITEELQQDEEIKKLIE